MLKLSRWMLICVAALAIICPIARGDSGVDEGTQESLDIVMEALKSGDPDMMAVAIALVRDIEGPEVTAALSKELPNLPTSGQIQLISALADRGDKTALPAVMKMTDSEGESVRIAAFKAIGQLGDASSVTSLAEAAASATGAEQKAARESLWRLRGRGVDQAILKAIESSEDNVKEELITAVGQRNIVSGIDVLLKSAKDTEAKVARESFKVLKMIGSQDDLPAIIELMLSAKSASVRSEAERTVAAIARKNENPDKQVQAVLAAYDRADTPVAKASLNSCLGKIGSDSGLDVLQDALSSDQEEVRESAIRALSDWPNGLPAADLLPIAATSENMLHRILALRGYVRLLGLVEDLPPRWTVAMYQVAMNIAPNMSEKKRVLSGLANSGSPEAFEAAAAHLGDKDVRMEAAGAVIRIGRAIATDKPDRVKQVMGEVIENIDNQTLKEQAQAVVDKIDEPEEEQDTGN